MKQIIALVAFCAVAACAPPGPARGTVVDKDHDREYQYWVAGTDVPGTCYTNGTQRVCSADVHIPGHWNYVPESWSLKIRDDDKEGWRDVDARTYYRCKINEFCDTDE